MTRTAAALFFYSVPLAFLPWYIAQLPLEQQMPIILALTITCPVAGSVLLLWPQLVTRLVRAGVALQLRRLQAAVEAASAAMLRAARPIAPALADRLSFLRDLEILRWVARGVLVVMQVGAVIVWWNSGTQAIAIALPLYVLSVLALPFTISPVYAGSGPVSQAFARRRRRFRYGRRLSRSLHRRAHAGA